MHRLHKTKFPSLAVHLGVRATDALALDSKAMAYTHHIYRQQQSHLVTCVAADSFLEISAHLSLQVESVGSGICAASLFILEDREMP